MPSNLPTQIQLEIVVPDRLLFSGKVERVTVPGVNGYMGILPGHAPLLSELRIGVISYLQQGRETRLFCSWGFVEVLADEVSILAEIAEAPEEIDVARAREELRKAEELLFSKDPELDYRRTVERWEMARTRLQVAGALDQ